MHYDESSRRLNLLSGLVFGAALGAGLALILLPSEPPARRLVRKARRAASVPASALRDRVADALARDDSRASGMAKRPFKL